MTPVPFSVGRRPGCSLQLNYKTISGNHADLSSDSGQLWVTDLGSTNGTYVNNILVKEKEIKHGDAIKICSYEYRVFDDQSNVGTQTEYALPDE